MGLREIELEDHGQDFTSLIVNERNIVVAALPFQSWVWAGFRIMQKAIRPGMKLRIVKGVNPMVLRYPVISVRVVKVGDKIKNAKGKS